MLLRFQTDCRDRTNLRYGTPLRNLILQPYIIEVLSDVYYWRHQWQIIGHLGVGLLMLMLVEFALVLIVHHDIL